ncbi:MAG: hypothetical protein GWO41_09320 [candidate division Zixibacteria bacterium]|nr:hypothetical protein [candidate division Zixibacteria bacterium]NIV94972.1 hypothetical protein [candidate division KSB1 bacterium]
MTEIEVHEIDIQGKYIIQFPEGTTHREMEVAVKRVEDWLEDDEKTFLFLSNSVKLVKVEQ